jgi:hypothetical protein
VGSVTPRPLGAYDLWRDELRDGLRNGMDVDELMLAAWCEAWGIQRLAEGDEYLAAMWFAEAEYHVLRMEAA